MSEVNKPDYSRPQAPSSSNLAVALAYIKKHPRRKLFPAKGKSRPCIKDNLAKASNDPAQLMKWAKEFPGCIFCCVPRQSGIVCIDADMGAGKIGRASLDKLVKDVGPGEFGETILDTETARTPSGGLHLIFEGEHKFSAPLKDYKDVDVPNYFVVPGQARDDGKRYTLIKDVPAIAAPAALQLIVKPPKPEVTRTYSGDAVPLELFKKMLAATPYTGGPAGMDDRHSYTGWLNFLMAAHEAAGGEEWGYLDAVIEWSLADPNQDWKQPTSAEYIERKWQSFNEDAANAVTRATWFKVLDAIGKSDLVGEAGAASDFEAMRADPANDNDVTKAKELAEAVAPDPKVELAFTPYKLKDPKSIEPRDWLYASHYIRKFVVADVSPGGTIKTSNALVEAVSMASGVDLLNVGDARMPTRALRVAYFTGEDTQEEIDRRIAAIVKHYSTPDTDVGGDPPLDAAALTRLEQNLFSDTGRQMPIKIASEMNNGIKIAVPLVEAIIQAVTEQKIDVLIIDPFVDSHAVNENDNTKIEQVVAQWRIIAERAGCCVCLVHHTRKGKPGAAMEYNASDARGASAIVDAARDVRVYNIMNADDADTFHIPKSDCWRYIRVDSDKPNMARRDVLAAWRYLESVSLDNSRSARSGESRGRPADNVGVVTCWQPPEADPLADAVLHEKILTAARKLYDEGKRITKANGPNRIKNMVPMFRSLTDLPTINAGDLKAAFDAAEIDGSWKYQEAGTGAHTKAGYYPADTADD